MIVICLLVVFAFLVMWLEARCEEDHEETKNINRLVKESRKEKRRKYTWLTSGTGKSAGR